MTRELYRQATWPILRIPLFKWIPGLVVVGLLIAAFWGTHLFGPRNPADESEPSFVASETVSRPAVVTLTATKLAAAGIHVTPVQRRSLQAMRTVAATINYDATRYLTVEAPVDCVVKTLLAKPGQLVKQGESLAVLSGSEIALARTEVAKCEADLRIAQLQFSWTKETQDNLVELLDFLKTQPTVAEIERQFDGKSLGEHRDRLLRSYSQFLLASSVATRTRPLGEQGIVAGRMAEARSSQRDVAATAFTTACEQSDYGGRRELAKSQAELDVAQQQLAVCQERLRLLLGPFAEHSVLDTPGDFELRAPFDGRIEALNIAAASRIERGQPVFVLADTTTLWVSALVHQHDWDALQLAAAQTVRVSVPAIPEIEFEAQVSFVGPEISPTTHAISLVAVLDNREGLFRPGMFAWVGLPVEPARQGLAVPSGAIQRHESEAFVFVQESQLQFRRIDVTTGIETSEYVELVKGPMAEQMVVDHGAFYLKSELLLEQESE